MFQLVMLKWLAQPHHGNAALNPFAQFRKPRTLEQVRELPVVVGTDGLVSVIVGNNPTPQPAGTIELASFVNPAGLEPRGQNLFTETPASGNPTTGTPGSEGRGPVLQGYLESSNVNVVQELVNMIQTQRAYEMNSRAIQTSDQMLQRLTQL